MVNVNSNIYIIFLVVLAIVGCCSYIIYCLRDVYTRPRRTDDSPANIIYTVSMNGSAYQNSPNTFSELEMNQAIQTSTDSTNITAESTAQWEISEGNYNVGFSTDNFYPPPSYNIANHLPSYQEVMTSPEYAHGQTTMTSYRRSSLPPYTE